jgi:hypothetical protein
MQPVIMPDTTWFYRTGAGDAAEGAIGMTTTGVAGIAVGMTTGVAAVAVGIATIPEACEVGAFAW